MDDEFPDEMFDAILHFQQRNKNISVINKLIETNKHIILRQKFDLKNVSEIENSARRMIEISTLLYNEGRMSKHKFMNFKRNVIESLVHETRWLKGDYNNILNPISEKMTAIHQQHKCPELYHWSKSDAPEEYQALSRGYDEALEEKLLETFCEFGCEDLKDFYLKSPEKIDVIPQGNQIRKLNSIAIFYENEAKLAKQAGAFLAASVMLGSAIETRLIIKCLENPSKVDNVLNQSKSIRRHNKSRNPIDWSLHELIHFCASAGWLPDYDTGDQIISGDSISTIIKKLRNCVHPKNILKNDIIEIIEERFKDADHAYKLLSSTLIYLKK